MPAGAFAVECMHDSQCVCLNTVLNYEANVGLRYAPVTVLKS